MYLGNLMQAAILAYPFQRLGVDKIGDAGRVTHSRPWRTENMVLVCAS